jgi:hypothetical protein
MFCTKCGQAIDERWGFCRHCGTPIEPISQTDVSQEGGSPVTVVGLSVDAASRVSSDFTPATPRSAPQGLAGPGSKGGRSILLTIIAVVVLAGIGLGLFFGLRGCGSDDALLGIWTSTEGNETLEFRGDGTLIATNTMLDMFVTSEYEAHNGTLSVDTGSLLGLSLGGNLAYSIEGGILTLTDPTSGDVFTYMREGAESTNGSVTTANGSDGITESNDAGGSTGGGAPSVVGLTLEQATQLAEEAGMKVEVAEKVPEFDIDASIVLSQEPAEGVRSNDNTLRLTVSREPVPVNVSNIVDVDPEGQNGEENHEQVPNLIDGKESTGWTTELYRAADFNDLKAGVGLDFTLEEEATIIQIISPVEGWEGELLENSPSDAMTRLATLEGKSSQIITLRQSISQGRLWFTKLTKLAEGERYGVEISEIRFFK